MLFGQLSQLHGGFASRIPAPEKTRSALPYVFQSWETGRIIKYPLDEPAHEIDERGIDEGGDQGAETQANESPKPNTATCKLCQYKSRNTKRRIITIRRFVPSFLTQQLNIQVH